jgi:Raf kinase inhibitor-like YbhB/YbcL family protein
MAFVLRSPAFEDGGEIPSTYTCEGKDISPALSWRGVPEGTRSLALIVDDPDAPDPAAPKRVWVHWVIYNMPPTTTTLPEAVSAQRLAAGTAIGKNDSSETGYSGPCPPIGRHRYFFKLYALDQVLPNKGALSKKDLEALMEGHIVGQAQLMGTYEMKKKR